ncbi:MAG: arylsulfatase [Candidatus Omnitrophica bacterium]|nr:Arylsulfatase [bacterium]NUN94903.1 arylsulfatase [Candidatus Omnitrophota bacterium]
MKRRSFLNTTTTLLASGVLPTPPTWSPPTNARPNILFILADDLGYGDLGCYGQKEIATPNLDRLASEGIRFTDCYAGSTVCAPSRCVLMTGLHTGHCHIRGNQRIPLRPEDLTVAELLKSAGYRTGLIGKWGLGNAGTTGVPTRKGFEEFFGYLDQGHAHNYYPEHLWHNDEIVEIEENLGMGRRVYSHDLFTQRALEFLHKEDPRPFFLYLAFTLPHANNERGRFEGNGMEVPDFGPYKDKDWPEPEKGRAGMIARLDRDIGKILEELDKRGLSQNTLVIFSSDNGPHKEGGSSAEFFKSSGPLRGTKRDLYEGGIRVPGIARWPGVCKPGETSDFPWGFWDFLPTAAELAGVMAPEGLDGRSILPVLRGEKAAPQEFLYWEFHERGFKQAARMGNWKGVRFAEGDLFELYSLATDLGETRDVSAANPQIVARIREFLRTARTESPHWPVR